MLPRIYRSFPGDWDTFFGKDFLPETVENDKIQAKHKDGILFVTIPKREIAKIKPARQIEIA
jgi:HSP20 family molecular chaperone IbpA